MTLTKIQQARTQMELDLTKNAMFLGVTRAMKPGAEDLLPEPKRDPRWKEDTWRANRQKAIDKARQKAMHWPITGYVQELTLIDWEGTVLLDIACATDDTAMASIHLCHFLASNPGILPRLIPSPPQYLPVRWFGFDIRISLAMIAMEVMKYDSTRPPAEQQPVPWSIWWHPHFTTTPFLDPFEMMLPSTVRAASNFTHGDLAKYFGLVPDIKYSPARQQAEFARGLVRLSRGLAGLGS